MYNAVLPAVSLNGKKYFYTNPLRVNLDIPYTLRWSKEREEYIRRCNCCPPNIVRTIAETGNYLYSQSNEGLWFNMYGGNNLETTLTDGSRIALEQVTRYPLDGQIRIQLNTVPDRAFSLFLRIPAWADKASLSINGKPADQELHCGTYAELRQKWKSGDVLQLDLPMKAKLMQSNPLVEETFNQVAVQRGPVVYCLESPDAPENTRIFNLAIPDSIYFTEIDTNIQDNHLIILEGDALLTSNGDWENRLYRELASSQKKIKIRLIPYYAWGNRGKSEMTVWMARH